MIEAVLFDFSGVLTTSPFTHMAALGAAAGIDGQVVLELMLGPYDEDTDHPWHRVERGEMSIADYAKDLVARAAQTGVEVDFSQLAGLFGRLDVQHDVVARVHELRVEGYKTGLVTNNVKEASGQWRAIVPVEDLFDAIVDSSEVGMRKPNPAIFLHALDLLGVVAPASAVFLDDAPGNVAGARRAGLHAILVDPADPAGAIGELDELLAAGGDRS